MEFNQIGSCRLISAADAQQQITLILLPSILFQTLTIFHLSMFSVSIDYTWAASNTFNDHKPRCLSSKSITRHTYLPCHSSVVSPTFTTWLLRGSQQSPQPLLITQQRQWATFHAAPAHRIQNSSIPRNVRPSAGVAAPPSTAGPPAAAFSSKTPISQTCGSSPSIVSVPASDRPTSSKKMHSVPCCGELELRGGKVSWSVWK